MLPSSVFRRSKRVRALAGARGFPRELRRVIDPGNRGELVTKVLVRAKAIAGKDFHLGFFPFLRTVRRTNILARYNGN